VTVAVANCVSEVVVQTEETYWLSDAPHTPTNWRLSRRLFPLFPLAPPVDPDKAILKYSVGAVLDTLTVKAKGVDEKDVGRDEKIPEEPTGV